MADRLFNGRTFSENGWPYVDEGSCTWIAVPGTSPAVHLQIQNGAPLAIMRAFAADFNAFVEDMSDGDSCCFTLGNSVASSNHPGATAMDIDWDRHKFQISYDGFSQAQIDTCRELLGFYEEMIHWGQDWGGNPYDCMHWQMGYDTYDQGARAPFPKVNDFIARKIRADGYSTFRRGNAPMANDAAHILSQATGLDLNRATEILPTMRAGLRQADCINPRRIAMFVAQTGEESAGFDTTEEYASGAEYEGRTDLGNNQPGDGVRFKGRTWIQVTGRGHYAEFSKWCFDNGLVPSPTQFTDNPNSLSDMQWAGVGAAWYWTVERPQINSLCDSGDLLAVTEAINGGTHGLDDRQRRYDLALALGDQLLELISGGDDLSAEAEAKINVIYDEITKKYPSRSALRHLDQSKYYQGGLVDTLAGMVLNVDANAHVQLVRDLASYHHPQTIALLTEIATADPAQHPDRADDIDLAQAILAEVSDVHVADQVAAAVAPLAPNAQAATTQVVYLPAPVAPVATVAAVQASSTGQAIGNAYDALEALLASGALTADEKKPFDALISVLQTKTVGVTSDVA